MVCNALRVRIFKKLFIYTDSMVSLGGVGFMMFCRFWGRNAQIFVNQRWIVRLVLAGLAYLQTFPSSYLFLRKYSLDRI